jgi:hypothetical protein
VHTYQAEVQARLCGTVVCFTSVNGNTSPIYNVLKEKALLGLASKEGFLHRGNPLFEFSALTPAVLTARMHLSKVTRE